MSIFFLLDRHWDYEEGQPPFRAGSVRRHFEFWENELKPSNFVLNVIKFGYFLPFAELPPPSIERNNKSSLRHPQFVKDSIHQLLESGCVREVSIRPHCVNPLTVAQGKKLRLVLDLSRNVNKYLHLPKFKYENLRTVADIIDPDDFFITFDLSNGYHHVPIAPEHQTYLGFAWDFHTDDGCTTRYFIFSVLAFGLASACFAFTKFMRPFLKKWRGEGKKSSLYLDDGILAAGTYTRALEIRTQVVKDLEAAGLALNRNKSQLIPTQRGTYLGFIIDTRNMEFEAPAEKIAKLSESLRMLLARRFATPKEIARIAGTVIALAPAFGSITSLFTRQAYKFIEDRRSWYQQKILPASVKEEFAFWIENLDHANGHKFRCHPIITKIIYSDASDRGYGGYILQRLNNIVAQGTLPNQERQSSSTHRELLAVYYMLKSFTFLHNETIQWHSDNSNVGRIIQSGSSKPDLHAIALHIYKICIANNIRILPTWVPREENRLADNYSRPNDTDDVTIDHKTFYLIQRRLGYCTIDRVADNNNAKLSRFNSKF